MKLSLHHVNYPGNEPVAASFYIYYLVMYGQIDSHIPKLYSQQHVLNQDTVGKFMHVDSQTYDREKAIPKAWTMKTRFSSRRLLARAFCM